MDSDMLDEPTETAGTGSSAREREAILAAASEVFLRSGYHGTNMDEIAELSGVSKQTVSRHFTSMGELLDEVVTGMEIGSDDLALDDLILHEESDPSDGEELARYLCDYAYRQLRAALTPRAMQQRRLATGEATRSPELAKGPDEPGPMSAQAALAALFERLADRGLIGFEESMGAADDFHWLTITALPLKYALVGRDYGIPEYGGMRRDVDGQVETFLALYGADSTWWARKYWRKGPINSSRDACNKSGGTQP